MPNSPPILLINGTASDSPALRTLTAAGYEVISATSEESALALAHQHRPGLVLFGDVASEDHPGHNLLQQLAAEQSLTADQAATAHSLEMLINNLPGMAYRCRNDRNWTMLFVSAGAEELSGYSADMLTGSQQQSFAELIHPDDRQQVWDKVQAALATQQIYRLAYRIKTRSGAIKWVLEQGFSSHKDHDGTLILDGFISDISQQKWYEAQLADMHSEKALILEATSEGIFGIDARGRCNFINRSGASMLGASTEALIGVEMHNLLHPGCAQQQCPLCHITGLSAKPPGESLRVSEDWFQRHDGTSFPVSWSIQRLHSANATTGAVITFSDISERMKQQERAHFNAERLHYIANASHDALWDINLVSGDTWWNEGIQALLGLTPTNSSSETQSLWTSGIHPDDRDRVLDSFQDSIKHSANHWEAQYRFVRPDSTVINVRARGYIVRDDSGLALRILGGMTDISQELLVQERLQQSQRLEALGQLTGGVAHDFNNLLTVIIGNSQLLEEELEDNPHLKTLAQMSSTAAQRGADLTSYLLAFARRQALDPVAVDINHLIDNVKGLLRHSLTPNIDLQLVQGKDLWSALADAAQLESALLHLVLNARDAMPEGGRLTVETANIELDEGYAIDREEVTPGRYVLLTLADTGKGIAQDVLPRVFDPFFTTKEKGKGTGLGLSMVYGFIKQSNGHIGIHSEEGVGTRVHIYLPVADSEHSRVAPERQQTESTTGSETILMVEDNDLVRSHVANLLHSLGYNVLVATNGHQAVDIIRQAGDIDLLFTDIIMPSGMNGRELAQIACDLRPGLKVLFTSGYTEQTIVHNGRLEKGVSLLSKPYRRAELAKKIRTVLDGSV